MIRTLSIIGTRPEAIKMAPVIRQLETRRDEIESVVCSTGQHREMLDQVLDLFDITPDVELGLMEPDQSLSGITARLFSGLDPLVKDARPDWILAQGDTTTVFVAAMVAFYQGVPFGHVEAGLRTGNRFQPWPEEVNRRVADLVSSLYFAPTDLAAQNLISEGCDQADVLVTGNTVVDAVREIAAKPFVWDESPLALVPREKRLVLVTAHRRESFGGPLQSLCKAISQVAKEFLEDGVHFVYPVHLNPNVRAPVHDLLGDEPNITLTEPLDYLSLVQLMKRSTLVLTDSGGIQEETPGFGVPVLVMRDKTERPEGVEAGVAELVGTNRDRIVAAASRLLSDHDAYERMATSVNPYGDGNAATRIVQALLDRR